MRKTMIGLISGLLLVVTSLPLLAMSHEDHALPVTMEHGGMSHEGMAELQGLGECQRENVHSRAEIKTYGAEAVAKMSSMRMAGTHHFMIYFSDLTGNELTDGLVALRIKGPDGDQSAPIKLLGMGKGFGADIVLDAPGRYDLEIGSKLQDGKKRVFEYVYEVN